MGTRVRIALAVVTGALLGFGALLVFGASLDATTTTLSISISSSGTVTLTYDSTDPTYDPRDFHIFELERSNTRNGTYSLVSRELPHSNT